MGFCFDFQGKVSGPVDNKAPLFCIAGSCALESCARALEDWGSQETLRELVDKILEKQTGFGSVSEKEAS